VRRAQLRADGAHLAEQLVALRDVGEDVRDGRHRLAAARERT
jgi:phytoene/squalene synthetase